MTERPFRPEVSLEKLPGYDLFLVLRFFDWQIHSSKTSSRSGRLRLRLRPLYVALRLILLVVRPVLWGLEALELGED